MNLLKDLQINDVSSVDVGAGRGVKIMLMKRFNPQESDMDAIAKAQGMNDRQMVEFCKTDVINKQQLGVLIDDLAQSKRRGGESRQQAYARFITENPTGVDLFKIHQAAPGRDHHQQVAFEKFHKAGA